MTGPPGTLPTGTVTFLFTDIEGSTELVERLAPVAYRAVLERHHAILRSACAAHDGVERGTQGDAFLVVFRDAPSAVAAAVEAQRALAAEPWPPDAVVRVRMGLHAGEGIPGGDDYVGSDINRAARVAAAAHGGQVLLSEAAMALTRRSLPEGVALIDLGEHRLRGLVEPDRLYQLTIDGLPAEFPPIRTVHVEPAHLPPRMTSFVGRERELAELERLLADNRLVTLLGAGGTGKTSLAVELARSAAGAFPDGVWFVPLDAISEPDLVGSSIVAALGLRDITGRTARERLIDNLADRTLLLVLDNFEQVLSRRRHRRRGPRRRADGQGHRDQPSTAPAGGRTGLRRRPAARPVGERRADPRRGRPRSARSACSWIASGEHNPRSRCRPRTSSRQPTSVVGSTACRSASSWRQRGSRSSAWPGSATAWRNGWPCPVPPTSTSRPASGPSRTPSPGASTCSIPAAQSLFADLAVFVGGCRADELAAVFDARRRPQTAMSSTTCRIWSTRASSPWPTTTAPRGSRCSRRSARRLRTGSPRRPIDPPWLDATRSRSWLSPSRMRRCSRGVVRLPHSNGLPPRSATSGPPCAGRSTTARPRWDSAWRRR